MKTKIRKMAILFMAIIAILIWGMQNNKKIEKFSNDAERFKYDYESWNGTLNLYGQRARALSIPEDNPFIYSNCHDISEYMSAGDSFIVYFGFPECPWCRSYIEALIICAEKCNIKTIYYVDVSNIRDEYVIKNGKPVKVSEARDDDYDTLLHKLDTVLSDYILYDKDGNEISVGTKRIYAPNIIAVKYGSPVAIASDCVSLTNPYEAITDEISSEMQDIFSELFALVSD